MVVEIKGLVKYYKEVLALDHVDLQINEGEIFGLLGPNGSGKTTLINCLLSLLKYQKGEIKIFNKKMSDRAYDIKKEIGVVMQDIGVYDEMTVYENIDYFCSLYIRDQEKRREYVGEAIQFVDLEEYRDAYPQTLSGGLLRRLNIACGIAHKPKFIIFDEPTVAIDPKNRKYLLENIKQLNKEGATILYTSHYMEEIEELCTQIAIMKSGKVIAKGSKSALKSMINLGEKITVEVSELPEQTISEIRTWPYVDRVIYEKGELIVQYIKGNNNLIALLNYLKERGIEMGNIYSKGPSLNDVFLEMIGEDLKE